MEMRKIDAHREARYQITPTQNLRIALISSQEQVISGSCPTVVRILLRLFLLLTLPYKLC